MCYSPAQIRRLRCVALHCIALHYIGLHWIPLLRIAFHCIALHGIASRRIALLSVALHYRSSRPRRGCHRLLPFPVRRAAAGVTMQHQIANHAAWVLSNNAIRHASVLVTTTCCHAFLP